MEIVDQSSEIYSKKYDIVKRIEEVARVCYKSEDLITEESGVKMVSSLIKNKHYAMLEHADIAFRLFDTYDYRNFILQVERMSDTLCKNYYFKFSNIRTPIVSGNIRVWVEYIEDATKLGMSVYSGIINKLRNIECIFNSFNPKIQIVEALQIKEYDMVSYEKLIHVRRSVKFITDRGISHEIVRHRPCSFAQESTRYCNYNKDKFGRSLKFIKPLDFGDNYEKDVIWVDCCRNIEKGYFTLIDMGCKPQEARDILPTCLKTEIVITANLSEWRHIFDLRVLDKTGPAHPKIKALLTPVYEKFIKEYRFLESK